MKRFFALSVLLPFFSVALCQHMMPGLNGKIVLLAMLEVKKELKLTKQQEDQIREIQQKAQKDPTGFGMPDMHYMLKPIDVKVVEVLDEGQRARLQELWLQDNGPLAISEPSVAATLELDEATTGKVKEIGKEFDRASMDLLMAVQRTHKMDKPAMEKLQKDTNDKILALLSEGQLKKWQEMLGKPFKFPKVGR
ncbi:MAG: hypothetical protein JSS66_13120 [Armatimonadetes bacterium]|nr:hypothetical protein [Armatimonadota bacterium]